MPADGLWNWLIYTDAGLLARVAFGSTIFLILAVADLRRNGSRATRWREYLFLLAVVALALVYGAINDQITSRISWEYFFYGKGLCGTLGPLAPPDQSAVSLEAMKIGMKATWSAGLIIGVALLLANNPSRKSAARQLAQLSYRRLFRYVPVVLICCLIGSAVLGWLGFRGHLTLLSSDIGDMLRNGEFRPARFMAVYGIHLGAYVGGIIGVVIAVIAIGKSRRSLPVL